MQYLEDSSLPGDDLEHHSECSDDLNISHFINSEYPENVATYTSVTGMSAALSAYFNFLAYYGLTEQKSFQVEKETKRAMLTKESENFKIKYIKSSVINELLLCTPTQSDNLIIQCGYKLGLRAKECRGLNLLGEDGLQKLVEQYTRCHSRCMFQSV